MAEVSIVPAWQRNDKKLAADAIAFWTRLRALPRDVTPADRAKELCAAAYLEDRLVGVSTIELNVLPQLRCRLGFFRCLVDPDHRRSQVARQLIVASRDLLSSWSKDNPEDRVLGMAAIVENPHLAKLNKLPVWPASRLSLVGYTNAGRQVRVVWFDHSRLD